METCIWGQARPHPIDRLPIPNAARVGGQPTRRVPQNEKNRPKRYLLVPLGALNPSRARQFPRTASLPFPPACVCHK